MSTKKSGVIILQKAGNPPHTKGNLSLSKLIEEGQLMKRVVYLLEGIVVLGVLLIGILVGMFWTSLNNDSLVEGPKPVQSTIERVAQDNK